MNFDRLVMTAVAAWTLGACAPAATSQTTAPAPEPGDPAAVAAAAARATVPASPRQLNFGWELDEAGAQAPSVHAAAAVITSRSKFNVPPGCG